MHFPEAYLSSIITSQLCPVLHTQIKICGKQVYCNRRTVSSSQIHREGIKERKDSALTQLNIIIYET